MKRLNNEIICYDDFMFFKDLLFPKFCLGCGFVGAYICINCQKKLSYIISDSCIYCGRPSLYGFTHPGCRRQNGIDGLLSILHYNNFLKAVIKSLKYRLATDVFKELCLVIEPNKIIRINIYKKINLDNLWLEAVPLHTGKLRVRGFNQAKMLADFLNGFLRLPTGSFLKRRKNTFSQAQMKTNKDRHKNVTGAFEALLRDMQNRQIILVDDVITTGSTLKEAARVLKTAGAKKVFVLTLAKG